MDDWQDHKLGQVINLKRGYDLPQQRRKPGPFPIVSSSGISDHHAEAKVKGPGVVTGRYGTLGEVFYIEEDFWPLNTSLYVQDFKGNDPRFISYFLRQLNFGTRNAAGAVPGVNRNHLHAMDVRVPPLPVQQQIARILSAYDELIENNLRRIRILEEMARTLYREWFVNFRFPGHEKVPLVDSQLGPIPKGWEIAKVGELLQKVPQQEKIKAKDYLPLGPLAVVDQGREFIGGYTDNVDASYSSDLPVIVFGDHTRVLKYIDFPFACGADGTQLLRSRSERMPMSLFFYALSAIELSNFAYARHFKFLKEQQLPLPDIQTALSFAGAVDSFREKISSLQKINDNLRHTRDLLLPKLISGEIRLKDRHRDTEVVPA